MSSATSRRAGLRGVLAAGVVAGLAAALGVTGSVSAAPLLHDDFEGGRLDGWSRSGGSWSVTTDGSQALRQSGVAADARARAGQLGWADYTVSARVRPIAFGTGNSRVGVLARAQGSTSYYFLGLRADGTLELGRRSGGSTVHLATGSAPGAPGAWRTVSLQVSGSRLTGRVDGGTPLTATDGVLSAGQVGLAAQYASASFDDVSVVTSPAPPGGPTPSAPGPSASEPTPDPTPSTSPAEPLPGQADGFAGVTAKGREGTTGGAGGPVLTATTTAQLLDYIKRPGPQVIQISGTITLARMEWVTSDKTVVGVGDSAVITGGGLTVKNAANVIIRNISFRNSRDDGINIDDGSHHVWVDHNTFGGAFDGAVDVRLGASYVTVSWNHFDHQDKNMLLGAADTNGGTDIGNLRVTYHHNFFDHTNQRNPRVRFGEPVHVYNNYYLNVGTYGVASTMDAGVLVEGNYFQNVPAPILSGYADSGPGRVVERGNVYVASGVPQTLGAVVEPSTFYSYRVDPAQHLPVQVPAGAGVGKLD